MDKVIERKPDEGNIIQWMAVYVCVYIKGLTRNFQENMSDITGLASATHIRSAVSPRFTNTGSFSALTLGASESEKTDKAEAGPKVNRPTRDK